MRREVLWHGNRERPSTWLRLDPHENIIRWAWVQYPVIGNRTRRIDDGEPIVRLSGQAQVDSWLARLGC
ncbi:hypothetical protein AAFP35_17325 [Gordonia sp. CPCC 206044]|uniref:hypothetical protein n=1 Tax=Gordonia sp. CPCC 206044 TaxID=3140793 RepID=UPI003AF33A74